jgi:hypothetical protein
MAVPDNNSLACNKCRIQPSLELTDDLSNIV